MSEETDRLSKELLDQARLVTIVASIHKVHQTQRRTIMAILEMLRDEKQSALDSADAALDFLLESQSELERILESLNASPDLQASIKAIRRG